MQPKKLTQELIEEYGGGGGYPYPGMPMPSGDGASMRYNGGNPHQTLMHSNGATMGYSGGNLYPMPMSTDGASMGYGGGGGGGGGGYPYPAMPMPTSGGASMRYGDGGALYPTPMSTSESTILTCISDKYGRQQPIWAYTILSNGYHVPYLLTYCKENKNLLNVTRQPKKPFFYSDGDGSQYSIWESVIQIDDKDIAFQYAVDSQGKVDMLETIMEHNLQANGLQQLDTPLSTRPAKAKADTPGGQQSPQFDPTQGCWQAKTHDQIRAINRQLESLTSTIKLKPALSCYYDAETQTYRGDCNSPLLQAILTKADTLWNSEDQPLNSIPTLTKIGDLKPEELATCEKEEQALYETINQWRSIRVLESMIEQLNQACHTPSLSIDNHIEQARILYQSVNPSQTLEDTLEEAPALKKASCDGDQGDVPLNIADRLAYAKARFIDTIIEANTKAEARARAAEKEKRKAEEAEKVKVNPELKQKTSAEINELIANLPKKADYTSNDSQLEKTRTTYQDSLEAAELKEAAAKSEAEKVKANPELEQKTSAEIRKLIAILPIKADHELNASRLKKTRTTYQGSLEVAELKEAAAKSEAEARARAAEKEKRKAEEEAEKVKANPELEQKTSAEIKELIANLPKKSDYESNDSRLEKTRATYQNSLEAAEKSEAEEEAAKNDAEARAAEEEKERLSTEASRQIISAIIASLEQKQLEEQQEVYNTRKAEQVAEKSREKKEKRQKRIKDEVDTTINKIEEIINQTSEGTTADQLQAQIVALSVLEDQCIYHQAKTPINQAIVNIKTEINIQKVGNKPAKKECPADPLPLINVNPHPMKPKLVLKKTFMWSQAATHPALLSCLLIPTLFILAEPTIKNEDKLEYIVPLFILGTGLGAVLIKCLWPGSCSDFQHRLKKPGQEGGEASKSKSYMDSACSFWQSTQDQVSNYYEKAKASVIG